MVPSTVCMVSGLAAAGCPTVQGTFALRRAGGKIPVIFDTDIGGDIDDTWALVMALQCPEIDVKLVSVDSGNTFYRARLAAKVLEACGRDDIPIAIGSPTGSGGGNQEAWLGDYDLDTYAGEVFQDGVGAMVDTILQSPDPVTVVAIGPVPNVSAALARSPDVTRKARFVGMHGAVRLGYGGNPTPCPEANVVNGIDALTAVLAADWECTLTPLDTCGLVTLEGAKYQRVFTCGRPSVCALMDNYRLWDPPWLKGRMPNYTQRSSTLFDCVAVYLAFSEDLVVMEDVPLTVASDGMTLEDPNGDLTRCAMSWRDLGAFEDLLVDRLVNG